MSSLDHQVCGLNLRFNLLPQCVASGRSDQDSQEVLVCVCVGRLTRDPLQVFEGDKVGADVLLPVDGL